MGAFSIQGSMAFAVLALSATAPGSDAFVNMSSLRRGSNGGCRRRPRTAALSNLPSKIRNATVVMPRAVLRVRGGGSSSSSARLEGAAKARGGSGQRRGRRGGRPLTKAWRQYLDALDSRPLVTKALTSGVIAGTANFAEQTLSPFAFSLGSWTVFTLVGAIFKGMFLHYWYFLLESVSESKSAVARVPSKWNRVFLQVLVDTSLGASLLNCGYFAMFTILTAIVEGTVFPLPQLGSAIVDKVAGRYAVMMINNIKIWPGVMCLNFMFVPYNLRVLVSNFVAVLWGYLLSKWVR